MGRFVNSGNSAFQVALNSEIYVDKTGLLAYTNKVMDTTAKFIWEVFKIKFKTTDSVRGSIFFLYQKSLRCIHLTTSFSYIFSESQINWLDIH